MGKYILLQTIKYYYYKVTRLCHWITLLHNNHIFHENAFLNLEILLKDIFEKCWHQHSCFVKMYSLSYLPIVQSNYFLEIYFACILNNITIKLKTSWKITIFSYHSQKCWHHQIFTGTLTPKSMWLNLK